LSIGGAGGGCTHKKRRPRSVPQGKSRSNFWIFGFPGALSWPGGRGLLSAPVPAKRVFGPRAPAAQNNNPGCFLLGPDNLPGICSGGGGHRLNTGGKKKGGGGPVYTPIPNDGGPFWTDRGKRILSKNGLFFDSYPRGGGGGGGRALGGKNQGGWGGQRGGLCGTATRKGTQKKPPGAPGPPTTRPPPANHPNTGGGAPPPGKRGPTPTKFCRGQRPQMRFLLFFRGGKKKI